MFTSARLIAGAHGAVLNNLTLARPGTMVGELVGKDHSPDMFVRISDHLGLNHNKLYCENC
jgi:capsular polysaccharide biosynthesis protein